MKTFFQNLWTWLSHWFLPVLHTAYTAYDNLPQEEKDALTHAVGFIQIVKTNLDATPEWIVQEVEGKYPQLHLPELEAAITSLLHTFNLSTGGINSLEDGIKIAQDYIKSHAGKALDNVLHAMATTLAHLMSPSETPLVKITSIIEAVFQALHKS